MNGQAAAFVFDPDIGISLEERLKVSTSLAQRCADPCGKRRLGVALPAIQAEVVDARNADVSEEFRAAAAADYNNDCVWMRPEAPPIPPRCGSEAHEFRTRGNVYQRPIEIEEDGDTPVPANLLSDAIPIFQ